MLKARRRKNFIDVALSDQPLTSFDFVRRAPFELDGQTYRAKPTSLLGVSYSLYRGDDDVVVEKTSLLTNAQQFEYDGMAWLMKPAHYFARTFNVQSVDGDRICAIVPARYLRPLSDITIDLPDKVPMLVQVFMLWLAVKSWTTDAAAGS